MLSTVTTRMVLLAELNEGVIPITEFASASNKRNSDFHEFFKTIQEIAWSRTMAVPYSGRSSFETAYISENYILPCRRPMSLVGSSTSSSQFMKSSPLRKKRSRPRPRAILATACATWPRVLVLPRIKNSILCGARHPEERFLRQNLPPNLLRAACCAL